MSESAAGKRQDLDDGILVAEFDKNASERVRVRLTEYKGHPLVDVRLFYDAGEEYRPTGKGFAFRRDLLPEMHRAIKAAMEQAGIRDDEDA